MIKIHKKILGLIFLIILIGSATYYFFFFETPEECFVREMKVWSDSKGISDMVKGITLEDAKMSVAKARAKTDEMNYDQIENEQTREIYIRVKTLFEYCEVK